MSAMLRSAGFLLVGLATAFAATPHPLLAQPRFPPPPRVSAAAADRSQGRVSLVSLHFQSTPPRDVLQSLAQQAGLSLDDDEVRDDVQAMAPITVDVDKQPFWKAALALTSQLNLQCKIKESPDFSQSESGWILEVKPGRDPAMQGPSQVSGPFLIVASSVARVLPLTAGETRPSRQQAHVEFTVLTDPQLRTRGRPRGQAIEVWDDQMRALPVVAKNYEWARDIQPLAPLMWRVKAVLDLPDAPVKSLGRVTGTLRGFLATTRNEVWEVTDIFRTQDLVKEAGGARFVVRQISEETGNFGPEYSVTLASDGVGEEADFGWPPRSDVDRTASVELRDSQGRRLLPRAWGVNKSGDYVIRFQPGPRAGVKADGRPTTLRWELPVEIVEFQIPFEFTSLPLP